jgi:hypothetical protein
MLMGHTTDLLVKGLDLLGIATKMTPMSYNDALGVVLQLEEVQGIAHHIRPTTMVLLQKGVAHLIQACLPLWVGAILDWVQRDRRAHSGRHVLRAQSSERHVSSLLHGVVHVVPDDPRGPWAPIRKHEVG